MPRRQRNDLIVFALAKLLSETDMGHGSIYNNNGIVGITLQGVSRNLTAEEYETLEDWLANP